MKQTVGILDYGGLGNFKSIQRALSEVGAEWKVITTTTCLKNVDKIILPGVGSFSEAMSYLNLNYDLEELKSAINKKYTLGICLGMHLLSRLGYEGGVCAGLNIMPGEVVPMRTAEKVPNMGFLGLDIQSENPLIKKIENELFYFMHSYEVINFQNVIALSTYGDHEFVSMTQINNVYGVQFHPEKSRDAGIQLFHNFIQL